MGFSPHLPPTTVDARLVGLQTSKNSLVSISHLTTRALGLQVCTTVPGFIWRLAIPMKVFKLI